MGHWKGYMMTYSEIVRFGRVLLAAKKDLERAQAHQLEAEKALQGAADYVKIALRIVDETRPGC
jgi:hypothetical protein